MCPSRHWVPNIREVARDIRVKYHVNEIWASIIATATQITTEPCTNFMDYTVCLNRHSMAHFISSTEMMFQPLWADNNQRSILQTVCELINWNLVRIIFAIILNLRIQSYYGACSCHNSSAVVQCKKLWLGWNVICQVRATRTCIFKICGLWTHTPLVKWGPCL